MHSFFGNGFLLIFLPENNRPACTRKPEGGICIVYVRSVCEAIFLSFTRKNLPEKSRRPGKTCGRGFPGPFYLFLIFRDGKKNPVLEKTCFMRYYYSLRARMANVMPRYYLSENFLCFSYTESRIQSRTGVLCVAGRSPLSVLLGSPEQKSKKRPVVCPAASPAYNRHLRKDMP